MVIGLSEVYLPSPGRIVRVVGDRVRLVFVMNVIEDDIFLVKESLIFRGAFTLL